MNNDIDTAAKDAERLMRDLIWMVNHRDIKTYPDDAVFDAYIKLQRSIQVLIDAGLIKDPEVTKRK